ncbi:MAG: gliding motility-associated C-terminal domain-containing protein [Sphingomonadales bacterium]
MKRLLLSLLALLSISVLSAQPCKSIRNNPKQLTTKCIKIHSILVDACGLPEGENEILLFYTGNASLTLSKLSAKWPTAGNNWLGLTQNATTAKKVSDINVTITGCGRLIEPVAGVIPANRQVYLFTSTNFIVGSNQFTNLSDTAYAIFQKSGNTAGHFANYSTPSGLRTTILSVAGSCSDTATYDKVKLVKQNGSVGAEDGGYVNFDSLGGATYLNDGCNAPVDPPKVSAQITNGSSFCPGDSVMLKGTVSGGLCYVWRAKTGLFSDTTSLKTVYYPDYSNPSAPELWLFSCKSGIKAAVSINIKAQQSVFAGKDTLVCAGNAIVLKMRSGAGPVLWKSLGGAGNIQNPSVAATTYVPAAGDTAVKFVLQAFNGCKAANDTFKAVWIQKIKPDFTLSDSVVCENSDSVILNALNKGGVFSGLKLSSTPAYWPSVPGRYRIVYNTSNKGCKDSSVRFLVVNPKPNPRFDFLPNDTVKIDVRVNVNPQQTGAYRHLWTENGNTVVWPILFVKEGRYRILHSITDSATGCTDTFSSVLTVYADEDIRMANVFTPNYDSLNEIFNFVGVGVKESNLKIFNRWGEKLFESNDQRIGWNGKTHNGVTCPEGVYFWQLYIQMQSGKKSYYSGTVTLLR